MKKNLCFKSVRLPVCLLLAVMLCVSAPGALAQDMLVSANLTLMMDDFHISRMASSGGKLYALMNDGLNELSVVDGARRLLSADIKSDWEQDGSLLGVDKLLAEGEKLYAINTVALTLYEIKLDEEAVQMIELLSVPQIEMSWARQCFVMDGQLVLLTVEGIAAVGLESKEITSIDVKDVSLISPYRDGLWAALVQERTASGLVRRLVSLDPESGEVKPLIDAPQGRYFNGLVYRPQDQSLLIHDGTSILAFREGEDFRELASYPRGDAGNLTLIGDHTAAILVDNMLMIRSLDPQAQAAMKSLSLLDPMGRGEEYAGFLKNYPDINLSFYHPGDETPEKLFVQDMLTRSNEVDIYLLNDQNLLDTIRRKGYAMDMAQNETIRAAVSRMHRPFREAVSSEKEILAFPKIVYLDMLSYLTTAFEELDLKVPETYEEYFDFCMHWVNELADEHPEYQLYPFENGMDLSTLLRRYADELSAAGEALVFSSDILKTLMEKYLAVYALPKADMVQNPQPLFYWYPVPSRGVSREYLPLRFDKERAFVVDIAPGNFCYFVINPYTENKEEALQFIESYQQHMEPMYRLILEENAEPMIDPQYDQTLRDIRENLVLLEEQAARTEGAERREWETRMKDAREHLEYYTEQGKWAVTQEDIDSYLALADSVYIASYNPVPVLEADYPDLFDSWRDNTNFDIDQFLGRLDDMVQKALAEQE